MHGEITNCKICGTATSYEYCAHCRAKYKGEWFMIKWEFKRSLKEFKKAMKEAVGRFKI